MSTREEIDTEAQQIAAQKRLAAFLIWEQDEFTVELLELLHNSLVELLPSALRIPVSEWDKHAREQDMGFIKGLNETKKVLKQLKHSLRRASVGDPIEEKSKDERHTPLSMQDINDLLRSENLTEI